MFSIIPLYVLSEPFKLLGRNERWSGMNAIASAILCRNFDYTNEVYYEMRVYWLLSLVMSIQSTYMIHAPINILNVLLYYKASTFVDYYISCIFVPYMLYKIYNNEFKIFYG